MGSGHDMVTCVKCGRVGFAVSKEYAKLEIKHFNEYYATLSKSQQKASYGGKKSKLSNYSCLYCKGSTFRKSKDGDCPDGCTISAVVIKKLID